jgi:hypothetical protein
MNAPNEIPKKLAYLRLRDGNVLRGTLEGDRFKPLEKREFPSETIRRSAQETADLVVQGLSQVLNSSKAQQRLAQHLLPLPPDALVDQNNPRVPSEWFKKAAKAGRFPCSKEGHKYIARWGDVQAALSLEALEPPSRTMGPRDTLREALGLRKKG